MNANQNIDKDLTFKQLGIFTAGITAGVLTVDAICLWYLDRSESNRLLANAGVESKISPFIEFRKSLTDLLDKYKVTGDNSYLVQAQSLVVDARQQLADLGSNNPGVNYNDAVLALDIAEFDTSHLLDLSGKNDALESRLMQRTQTTLKESEAGLKMNNRYSLAPGLDFILVLSLAVSVSGAYLIGLARFAIDYYDTIIDRRRRQQIASPEITQ